jgi:CRISPR/Cas system endoribonuclease Cas6 (RAMP superfamily)
MGGLVGRVTYEGDLSDYLPLLALGELVHVGKGTVFGNGQYQIERREKEQG